MSEESDRLESYLSELEEHITRAIEINESRMGIAHNKTITHCMSMQLICEKARTMPEGNRLLDHFSVAALSRCVIDSAIMTLYLSEPSLSLPQWDLRRHILFLHDLSNRKRFLTALQKARPGEPGPPFFENYENTKRSLKAVIERRCVELGIPAETQVELGKGQLVFIDGTRGAVREAGLDIHTFDFLHSYLSNHVHSHPVSVLRATEHGVSFQDPSAYQLDLATTCITAAGDYLLSATERIVSFTGDINRDPVGPLE
jgi:hypothetical protein